MTEEQALNAYVGRTPRTCSCPACRERSDDTWWEGAQSAMRWYPVAVGGLVDDPGRHP